MESRNIVNSYESLDKAIERSREAQRIYATYSQEQVDNIFKAAALAANDARISLAAMAVDETGMGIVEDKVIKNHFAAEYIYNKYRDTKTCGLIYEDDENGMKRYAEPVGLVAAVIPTTNPTSTAIFKCLLCLKTRNAIILSPHPRAKKSTIEAAKIVLEAAVKAGAPANIIEWIDEPSLDLSGYIMKKADMILATGGPSLVKAAYSSGTPAVGVGSGNTPAIIDESADILMAVNSIIHSKTFDNGVVCASEQAVLVHENIYEQVKNEFLRRNCYILNEEEKEKVRKIIIKNGVLNPGIVGQSAHTIAGLAGIHVDENTKILIGEVEKVDKSEEFANEKLSPVLAMYKVKDMEEAFSKAEVLITEGGYGHTSSIFIDESNRKQTVMEFVKRMKTCRILINMPASQGGVGDLYNFSLAPSLTLGCGSWGGNSVSENVGVEHLINIKSIPSRRENMLWLRLPEKVYHKKGCLPEAMRELKSEINANKVFVVTDSFLYKNGHIKAVTDKLDDMGISYVVYFEVEPDPTLSSAVDGAAKMRAFEPDCIIAIGGGSAMDAAKIMWVMYEHPEVDFLDMALRFMDIRKRIYRFPKMGKKAYFIAIPTSAGTGSEVTPFAVITDESTGVKYPLADYELLPDMAIIDVDFHMSAPKGLTAASGIDALIHALEAYVSIFATDYTDGLSLKSIKLIFQYFERAYENGQTDERAREKMANAATLAGIAFANSFLGICHSMAHKLGAAFHLPHGVANALMIESVIRYNADDNKAKMGTLPQYEYPHALRRYAEIAEYLGLAGNNDEEKLESLIAEIDRLKALVGIKSCIRDYGIEENEFMEKLDSMSWHAFDDQCTGANPRYPMVEDIRNMYLEAYHGKEK